MTRKTLDICRTIVIPSRQRDLDRNQLESLARELEAGRKLEEAAGRNYARTVRRYLANEYPANRRGKPSTAVRDHAIAEAYVLMHEYLSDRYAANKIAAHCRGHGADISAQTVSRIARRGKDKAKTEVASFLLAGQQRYTRESMIEARLNDALRRAAKM